MIFGAAGCHARELHAADVPRLQVLFDANPEYFLAVNGRPPRPDEAQVEFDERPPPQLPFARQWLLGLHDDATDELVGVAIVAADLMAAGIWHVALFLVATRLHGRGVAQALYAALERWARREGAVWMRLGVVAGNARAEAFWARRGYREVRRREGVDTGGRINDVRVLVKPLREQGLEDYLARAPRDRPDSTLP
jgi:GNAT superfamily N-acetyltransferase